jgi:hypothetical protein
VRLLAGEYTAPSLLTYPNHGVMCGNPACRTILSPAMIAYALGARTVRDNSTNSRTPPLGTALPRHPGLRTRHQRARQRIPGILHLAQRKCWRSAAGDPQTLAAPVADIAGNAFCSHSKKCEASTNDAQAEGARSSSLAHRWLESMRIAICPTAHGRIFFRLKDKKDRVNQMSATEVIQELRSWPTFPGSTPLCRFRR